MPSEEQETKRNRLEHGLRFQIKLYKRMKERNGRLSGCFQLVLILLAFSTTIVVGYQYPGATVPLTVKNVALVLSALTTVVAGIEAVKNYRGTWLLAQEVYLLLINLKANYRFELAGSTNEDEVVGKYWDKFNKTIEMAHKNRIESSAESTDDI